MAESWGRFPRLTHREVSPSYGHEVELQVDTTLYGQGRSYGDVALNSGGRVVKTGRLCRLQSVDWDRGVLRAEAGMTLAQILEVCLPKGWFLPVTPGSKFVSLGGAVANDVHGKNHHQAGSFGAHVRALGLRRSDGEALVLSPQDNSDLFALTISGLGLTGLIEWVEIQLQPVVSPLMQVENIRFAGLEDFFELCQDSKSWPYHVAWLDCFAPLNALGRGIFTRAKHQAQSAPLKPVISRKLTWPLATPAGLMNRTTISVFNRLYRARPGAGFCGDQSYDSFFYPLDGINRWNLLYGPKGFYQHQSLIPEDQAAKGVRALLSLIAKGAQGSFLAVLKTHGPETSPGKNSFCGQGVSLALDFANRGQKTRDLLSGLEDVVLAHGGRLYPAKDASMRPQTYQVTYPNWTALEAARDPALTSAFWQRVTQV